MNILTPHSIADNQNIWADAQNHTIKNFNLLLGNYLWLTLVS